MFVVGDVRELWPFFLLKPQTCPKPKKHPSPPNPEPDLKPQTSLNSEYGKTNSGQGGAACIQENNERDSEHSLTKQWPPIWGAGPGAVPAVQYRQCSTCPGALLCMRWEGEVHSGGHLLVCVLEATAQGGVPLKTLTIHTPVFNFSLVSPFILPGGHPHRTARATTQ